MVNFHPFNHCCRVTLHQNSFSSGGGGGFWLGGGVKVKYVKMVLKHHGCEEAQEGLMKRGTGGEVEPEVERCFELIYIKR